MTPPKGIRFTKKFKENDNNVFTIFNLLLSSDLPKRTIAMLNCVNKHARNYLKNRMVVIPVYADILVQIENYIKNNTNNAGVHTIYKEGWGVRVTFVDNGKRIRIDFQEPNCNSWCEMVKIKPDNFKKCMHDAIEKERTINMKNRKTKVSRTCVIESLLVSIAHVLSRE